MKVFIAILLASIVLLAIPLAVCSQSPDPQTKLETVIPVAPTAASIAKYGNIPVNLYTGSPTISVPLFQIASGDLKLPVALNYQFNGLKVEEIASWVGLGWSLEAGGSISRTIRGISDDDPNGYPRAPMTTKFIIDSMVNPTYQDDIKFYLKEAGQGRYDLEPDIYYFNCPGGSGKFFYNQERGKYLTMPAQNIKVGLDDAGFVLTTSDGTTYHFSEQELNVTKQPTCTGSPTPTGGLMYNITSWYLVKIRNKTRTDSIIFEYGNTLYDYDHLATSSKYILTHAISDGLVVGATEFTNQQCQQNSQVTGKRLSYIRFRNGSLKFSVFNTDRDDLRGDTALQKIELFNKQNELIKSYTLDYDYFGSGSNARLKLLKVTEKDKDGATQNNPYQIAYEETGSFPGRLSYAQDHWGYYNGATTNDDMIPTIMYKTIDGYSRYIAGDDRKPNFTYAKLGAIKKLTYPTGGSTEFEFENNEVKDSTVQPEFNWHIEHIEGDHNGGIQTIYIDTFVVNEPPNYYNFFDPDGGAYADFLYAAIGGCDFSGGATTCAILTVEGISTGTVSYGPLTTPSSEGQYLPNGTYILKATFNQSPPLFEDFYFSVKWRQPILNNSYLIGGIRIKKITDCDSIDLSKKSIRKFTYSNDLDSLSSGKVCGYPNGYQSVFHHEFYDRTDNCSALSSWIRYYIKMTSLSTYPLVASQGDYVGYEQVNVFYGENAENGKTVHKYQYFTDIINTDFPQTVTSREWNRGLLLEEKTYTKDGSVYSLILNDSTTYSAISDVDTSVLAITYALKTGYSSAVGYNPICAPNLFVLQAQDESLIPAITEYEVITNNANVRGKEKIQYADASQLRQWQQTTYSGKNYLPNESKSVNSIGDTIIKRYKYNTDYTLVSNNPAWLKQLLDKAVSSVPIEILTLKKSPGGSEYVTAGVMTFYKNDKPLVDKMFVLETTSPIAIGSFTQSSVDGSGNFVKDSRYKEKIVFDKYDVYNNIVQQRKSDDNNRSYIWDYLSTMPIAEVINADSASIAFTSFEADGKGNWAFSGSTTTHPTSPTGSKGYSLAGGDVTKSGLSSGTTYLVTYWKRDSSSSVTVNGGGGTAVTSKNGWILYSHEITSTTTLTISGTAYIDELRLHPKGSWMTTYAYAALIGVTSQCDPNNRITYYEYDSFGRLKLIRDIDRRVVKRVDYKYQATYQQ